MAEEKKKSDDMFQYDETSGEDIFDSKKEKTEWIGSLKSGGSMTIRFLKELPEWSKAYKHDFVKASKDGRILNTKGVDKDKGERMVGSFVCISTKANNAKGIHCPLCEAGNKPKATFGVQVIDRATNTVKFFESNKASIYYQLKTEFQNNGTITDVDFKISREGTGLQDTKYTVGAIRKSMGALKPEEQEMAKQIKVEKYFTPKTREQIFEALKGNKEKGGSDDVPGSTTLDEDEEVATPF